MMTDLMESTKADQKETGKVAQMVRWLVSNLGCMLVVMSDRTGVVAKADRLERMKGDQKVSKKAIEKDYSWVVMLELLMDVRKVALMDVEKVGN